MFMALLAWLGLALTAGQPEVLYVDASQASGATTQSALVSGVVYSVQIRGTISKWSPQAMASLCAGTPDSAPQFPSSGVTGPASVDAEWVWAWPKMSPSLCPHEKSTASPPVAERSVLMSLTSAKPTPLPQPTESGMTSNHIYTYKIVGQGAPAVFVVNDRRYKDNYGQFQITVTPTP
jgi:hypothetical protein